jgi:hypothetical protein
VPAVAFTAGKGKQASTSVWAGASARLDGPVFLLLEPLETRRGTADGGVAGSRLEAFGTGKP